LAGAIGRSREHSIDGSHAHGAAFRAAVERIVREPRVSRLSAPNGGAGEVFVQQRGSIDAIADLTECMAHAEFQRTVRSCEPPWA